MEFPPEPEVKTGWQADKSYIPCPDCELVPDYNPVTSRTGVTIHYSHCPQFDWMKDVAQDLAKQEQEKRRYKPYDASSDECEICGAIVRDTTKHTSWHESQRRPGLIA